MKVELLAPGGSYESSIAALNAGADAVYTGGDLFGARAGADNLSTEQLIDLINYAHIHNKKIYLTVNTLLKDNEIENMLYGYLLPLYEQGLDAVIVQDMGVLIYIKNTFPNLHIHASTQMTIFGQETVKELEKLGVERIVTPRELSLEEIKKIKKETSLEIESFVHGALCYCYSGQCFMSSYIGGRSGNRGRCAQPCRMEYDVIVDNKIINQGNKKYVLSPKDICTLKFLPEIIESGVYSLKIEGRMKKVEYISGVVSIYRKYLDMYLNNQKYQVSDADINKLNDLFNRNGFNESYYKQHNGKDMISLKKPEFRTENKEFTDYLKDKYLGKKLKRKIDIKINCVKDQPFSIETNIDNSLIKVEGPIPSEALNKPLDKEGILKHISKLGDTDFILGKIDIFLDEGMFIPVGVINQTRRDFIERVYEFIIKKHLRKDSQNNYKIIDNIYESTNNINAHVWTIEQANIIIKSDIINSIYLEESEFSTEEIEKLSLLAHKYHKELYIALPYVFREKDKNLFDKKLKSYVNIIDGFLIRNQEQYFMLKNSSKKLVFDYNVYGINKISKHYYQDNGKNITTTPLELNYKELLKRGCLGDEFILYGYMPVMISANCSLKTCDLCRSGYTEYKLRDRKFNDFNTKAICKYCYNVMFNCKPLSLFGYINQIKELKPYSYRLVFTNENTDEIKIILKKAEDILKNNIVVKEDESTTRGHFKRGVL